MKSLPDFKLEVPVWNSGMQSLGIDEAGRGAFAGPLAVGGVIFNKEFAEKILELGLNDSKLLSAKKRESLYLEIKKYALFSHVEFVSLEIINEIGIGKATFLGMEKVVEKAKRIKQIAKMLALIDGFEVPTLKVPQIGIVKGDRLSISIAAASILAKVERDNLMQGLSKKFPEYGFDVHKGYGTLMHRNILKHMGPSIHHRTQFVRNFI